MKQYLFVLLGYPGSGKSYFARQLAMENKYVRLNGDGIRYSLFSNENMRRDPSNNAIVFGALDYATHQILSAGYSVVYDASHNRRVDRYNAEKLGKQFGIRPIIVWIQVTPDIAKARHETRERRPDQPFIPPKRFEELVSNLEIPEKDELCIIIDGMHSYQEQIVEFQEQLLKIEA